MVLPDSEPSEYILPDLVGDCHYPLRLNLHRHSVSHASEQWLINQARIAEPRVTRAIGFHIGELPAACHPDADALHLQVISDCLNWFFNTDDWLEEFDVDSVQEMRRCCMSALRDPVNFQTEKVAGILCKSYFGRFTQTAGLGCTERFIHTMDLYFISVAKQVDYRAKGHIPDLESYIALRRDTGGCKPCFALIEYGAQIDLPNVVLSHPVIMAMEEAANDFITSSNDIFSYNLKQCRGDGMYNMVAVVMGEQGLDLQSAVDYVGQFCNRCIQRFDDHYAIIPSWGEELDKQVAIYVEGLRNWIVGYLHWSFVTSRYFGENGHAVKRDRIVKLVPKTPL